MKQSQHWPRCHTVADLRQDRESIWLCRRTQWTRLGRGTSTSYTTLNSMCLLSLTITKVNNYSTHRTRQSHRTWQRTYYLSNTSSMNSQCCLYLLISNKCLSSWGFLVICSSRTHTSRARRQSHQLPSKWGHHCVTKFLSNIDLS